MRCSLGCPSRAAQLVCYLTTRVLSSPDNSRVNHRVRAAPLGGAARACHTVISSVGVPLRSYYVALHAGAKRPVGSGGTHFHETAGAVVRNGLSSPCVRR